MPRRLLTALALTCLSVAAGFASSGGAIAALPLPPFTYTVDTTSDAPTSPNCFPGGHPAGSCSLREAIIEANGHRSVGPDVIAFSLGTGTPVINIGPTALPAITDELTIYGHSGGAARVEVHGDGSVAGLDIQASAPTTLIDHLVLNNFVVGPAISVEADNVSITGNFIGTNADGSLASPNFWGVEVSAAGIRIGGANGVTPGGSCTGDCNLISASSVGIFLLAGSSNATIEANFFGTNADGTALITNFTSIEDHASNAIIGGTTTGSGNVIEGVLSMIGASHQTVEGNVFGTDPTGTTAIQSANSGISTFATTDVLIGGTTAAARNVIASEAGDGVFIQESSSGVRVQGNFIGVAADGSSPFQFEDHTGIDIRGASNNAIGGTNAGESNIIAYSYADDGVRVEGSSSPATGNSIRGNSIYGNAGKGIHNIYGGNNELPAPVITMASGSDANGAACVNCSVDIYSDNQDEGRVYEGSTSANGSGLWSFSGSIVGPHVTATNTDANGNTSEFSAPVSVPHPTPTPSPSPTPSTQPTPTPTATPTHTPSSARIQGDANCDGHVTEEDGVVILEESEGLVASCAQTQALHLANDDTNCDGAVTPIDALDVLRHLAGLSELSLPTGCPQVGAALP